MNKWFKKVMVLLPAFLMLAICASTAIALPKATTDTESVQTDQKGEVEENLQNSVFENAFSSDHFLKGSFDQGYEFFQVGNWKISEAKLVLQVAATPLLRGESAELLCYINDEQFYSCPISDMDKARREIVLDLPVEKILSDQWNSVAVKMYARGNADFCADDDARFNWINIFKESYIKIWYTPADPCATIRDFYRCFTSIDALYHGKSSIFVPAAATNEELTVAAMVASGVSKNAALNYENIGFHTIKDSTTLQKYPYSIYVCDYDGILPEVKQAMTEQQQAIAQRGTLAALVRLERSSVLILTGKPLSPAGVMLSNAKYMDGLSTDTNAIAESDEYYQPEHQVERYIPLSEAGTYVRGSFIQSAVFYIDYPANRKISKASELSLDFRYSEDLDFERALVTVYLDEVPIGSKRLRKETARDDSLQLQFPKDVDITGDFTVRVTFDLEVGDMWCKLTPDEMPWAFISDTSMLKLQYVDYVKLEFDNYPSPFIRDGSFNNVVVLLPDEQGEADLTLMHTLMLAMGRYLKDNRGSLRVASYSDPGDISRANIIAIGNAQKNALLKENMQLFHFQFNGEGSLLLTNDKMQVEGAYGTTLGIAQLIISPFSEYVNAILAISGVTDQAMLQTLKYLDPGALLWKISGDAFVAHSEDALCFEFDTDAGMYSMPVQQSEAVATGSASLLPAAASAVAGLCLLATLLIIRKHRRRPS